MGTLRPAETSDERGAVPIVGIMLIVALAILISMVVFVGVAPLLPSDADAAGPGNAYTITRDDGSIDVVPQYTSGDREYELIVDGRAVETWRSGALEERLTLRCLFPEDRVAVRERRGDGTTFVVSRHDVVTPTDCPLSGTAASFASAIVDGREVNLFSQQYEFTLQIDPQGEGTADGVGPVPVTNDWHYVQRYDRSLEGLSAPVYVVVLADNADYDADAPADNGANAYAISGDSIVPNTGSGTEPTNDIYLAFSPGCDASTLKLVAEQAGYDNSILVGDEVVIEDTNAASAGTEYEAPAATCV
jgi:hypothetical protein